MSQSAPAPSEALKRRARVGIVGGGQLARMMAISAAGLDVAIGVLAESPDDSATAIATHTLIGAPDSESSLRQLCEWADVVTFDHEHVPPDLLRKLEGEGHKLHPTPGAKIFAQDKHEQRRWLGGELGLPVPPNRLVATLDEVEAFGVEHGWPVMLKYTRGGYDGKGLAVVGSAQDAQSVLDDAERQGVAVLAEELVSIEREIAVVLARAPSGHHVVYPVVETVQRDGICHEILAPAPISDELLKEASDLAVSIAAGIGATGIMAVEMFIVDGRLMINELALRPHNSGHFSLGGSITSQFENHLRAVLDWPLGDPSLIAPAVACVNVLGDPAGTDPSTCLPEALAVTGAAVQLYGKQARPGRKLGHVTVAGPTIEDALSRARQSVRALTPAAGPVA